MCAKCLLMLTRITDAKQMALVGHLDSGWWHHRSALPVMVHQPTSWSKLTKACGYAPFSTKSVIHSLWRYTVLNICDAAADDDNINNKYYSMAFQTHNYKPKYSCIRVIKVIKYSWGNNPLTVKNESPVLTPTWCKKSRSSNSCVLLSPNGYSKWKSRKEIKANMANTPQIFH
jgi:hypothetical protein